MNKTPTPLNILFIFAALGVVLWGGLYIFMVYSFFNLRQQGVDTVVSTITIDRVLKKEAGSGDVLKSYFIKAGQEAPFVSSIEAICKSVSVSCVIRSIDEGDVLSKVPVKPLHLVVVSSGGFDNTMQLLHLFEFSSYPITISNVNISKTTSWNGSFDLSLPVLIN
ncbi:MAG: hypothetical protein WC629_00030 [Candidatus Paceibacterota bacterium]|jgi:hypothetical protein